MKVVQGSPRPRDSLRLATTSTPAKARRRGVLVEDMGQTWLAEPDADGEEARTLRPLQAAAITLQAAPGQWPGPSPDTNSPLDCLCPGSRALRPG